MSSALLTWALLCATASPPAPPSEGKSAASARSIAILDVKSDARDADAAALFARALAQAAARQTKARVISADELRGLLDAAANQALLGCNDDARCAIDRLHNTLAVDEIVIARIGSFDTGAPVAAKGTVAGEQRLLAFLSLVDTRTASVIARASTSIARSVPTAAHGARDKSASAAADAMRAAADSAATRLWSDVAKESGDRLLSEMRIALVLDEAIASGSAGAASSASEKLRAVEACVQEQLVDAGVVLVAPDSVAALRGVSAEQWLASLSSGTAPSFLGSSDVDALLIARVEYTPAAPFAGAERADADMALRLVQVDTGTIVAAKQLRAAGNGFNGNGARKEAAKKLCADVRPLLAQALDVRRSRGSRVVVEVRPAATAIGAGAKANATSNANAEPKLAAGDAEAIAAQLAQLTRVARVRVARYDEKSATLELMVAGGDGIALALDMLGAERALITLDPGDPGVASTSSASITKGARAHRSLRVVSAEPSVVRMTTSVMP